MTIPGGVKGIMSEIAVTPLQISLVTDPAASIRDALRDSDAATDSEPILADKWRARR